MRAASSTPAGVGGGGASSPANEARGFEGAATPRPRRLRARSAWPGQIAVWSLALTALALGLWTVVCSAQAGPVSPGRLTVDAVMSKGPAAAPVTIVEFSDYE